MLPLTHLPLPTRQPPSQREHGKRLANEDANRALGRRRHPSPSRMSTSRITTSQSIMKPV
jgi:hypothetical protein